jgi:helix-turn-helix, Psq domain
MVPVTTWNRILIRKGTKLNNFKIIVKNAKMLNFFRLSLAVDECRAGKMSQRAAAEKYQVKKSIVMNVSWLTTRAMMKATQQTSRS